MVFCWGSNKYEKNDNNPSLKLFKEFKICLEIVTDNKITIKNVIKSAIIIDDLEKKDNTDKLFLEDLRSLDDIEVTKIITMPIHLRRTQTFQDKDIREFALKLHSFDGAINEEDKKLLKEVIDKRIEKNVLFFFVYQLSFSFF